MKFAEMKQLGMLCGLLLALWQPLAGVASEAEVHLDRAPIDASNQASLQRGARVFVNYCLNCHSAAYMRYNRLVDIGLTEAQIKDNLVLTGAKVGDTMKVVMPAKDAKAWFGAQPPDLTVEARARGADWLYTYLRGFYRDSARPTGWNNTVYDKVAMPHVLWELQGQQVLKTELKRDAHGHETEVKQLVLDKPGKISPAEYDATIADLVNYMVFMSEPSKGKRLQLGVIVLLFLGLMFIVSYYLKKEFWKDVH